MRRRFGALILGAMGLLTALSQPTGGAAQPGVVAGARCATNMVAVDGFCIDAFEASVEALVDGAWVPHEPNRPVAARRVRAVSAPRVLPQAYISQEEAKAACREAGKRLCTTGEWVRACKGTPSTLYPYGTRRRGGLCNDRGREPLAVIRRGASSDAAWSFDAMNDPRLSLVAGGLAPTGLFSRCRSDEAIYDMVGNLHEWTADERGALRGGFYLDVQKLGEGCDYEAIGHDTRYRDYSTGFRCCSDAGAGGGPGR